MFRRLTLVAVMAAVLGASSPVCAQGIISTVAGSGKIPLGSGGPALKAPLGPVSGIVVDSSGNVIACDSGNNVVVSISPLGVLNIIAGNGTAGFAGDLGLATKAQLNIPQGLALDSDGNLLIADRGNNRIRKVDTNGFIYTIAGNGIAGFSGDGDLAVNAQLNAPTGVAVDAFGTIYIADSGNNRVRKVQRSITTIAGTGVAGFSGDGSPAASAQLNNPVGVATDPFFGNVFISDSGNNRIRLVTISNGTISTVAGTGVAGFSGDGGPAIKAQLNAPELLSSTSTGTVYLADSGNNVIRKLFAGGQITTVAGNATAGFFGDGGAATQAQLNNPMGAVADSASNVFITDTGNFRVREVSAADGTISTIAGSGTFTFAGDGGPATSAILSNPMGVVVDMAGNFYIADTLNERIRKVIAAGTISTVAGNGSIGFSGDSGPATSAQLNFPSRVALDAAGNLYVADTKNNVVRKVTPGGTISTVAGNGNAGFAGDGGPAASAQLNNPVGLAVDTASNLYIADELNSVIRKVTPGGTITTVAGTGVAGFNSDGVLATTAQLNLPMGVLVDSAGSLFIADTGNNRIRKITGGKISTVAGTGKAGFSGDGGLATSAQLNVPTDVALDFAGTLYIADSSNNRIRKVAPDGTVGTVAGTGQAGFTNDGALATTAQLNGPQGVAVDVLGSLFVADTLNGRIRKVQVAIPVQLTVTPASLTFTAPAAAANPPPQTLLITAGTTANWVARASTQSGGPWLTVSPGSGSTPATLTVSVNLAGLAGGTYQGTVTVQAPGSLVTVGVSLAVQAAAPPQLSVSPGSLNFQTSLGVGNPPAQFLVITNTGSGTLSWTAQATSSGNWLLFPTASGSATAGSPVAILIIANVTGLAAGVYPGSASLSSSTTGQTITITATLVITQAGPAVVLAQTGLLFTGVQGGGPVASQTFGILNGGSGSMNWTVSASTLSGGSWLGVSPASGTSVAGSLQAPQVTVQANIAGLAAGSYSGLVRVDAAGAANTPQLLVVILNVLAPGSNPGAVARPAGLTFTAQVGTSSPAAQTVQLTTSGPGTVNATVGVETASGGNWLSSSLPPAPAQPATVAFSAASPQTITVQAALGTLAAGVYRGSLTILFDDGSPAQVVDVVFVVAGTSAAQIGTIGPAAAACTPQKLLAVYRASAAKLAAVVALPSNIEVQVTDDCGNAVLNATAVASFSSGDPPLRLTSQGNGTYTATWRPLNATAPVTISVRADSAPLAPATTQSVYPQVQDNPKGALVFGGGVVSAASFTPGQPFAPGSIVSVFGRNLAASTLSATTLPLPPALAGSSLSAGILTAPLFSASAGQINAQLPFEVAVNSRQQMIAQVGSAGSLALTVPESFAAAATSPGIFTTNSQGTGQGEILIATTGEVAAPSGSLAGRPASAARRGEFVAIFSTGLGLVNNQPPNGAAALVDPLSTTLLTPTVTIGGVPATVGFSGLAPFLVGLDQVNVQVPDGAPSGDTVPVVLTIGGVSSNSVTMAVQ